VNRDGCLFEAFKYIAKRWSALTEDMLVEMILTGGSMAERNALSEAAFQLRPLIITDDDKWLDMEREKEREELYLDKVEREDRREERAAVARDMLSKGFHVNVISISTGLTSHAVTVLAYGTAQ